MSNQIDDALKCLARGEVIVTPSESCYGFSCDASNRAACEKLNTLKGNREGMALTLLVSDLRQLATFGEINDTAKILSAAFHPGQLNLIIDKKPRLDLDYLSTEGIAFRIPAHPQLFEIVERFGRAITTTSANMHGKPPLYTYSEVAKQFRHKVCTTINGGDLDQAVSVSTVYDTRSLKIVREGPIGLKDIEGVLAIK